MAQSYPRELSSPICCVNSLHTFSTSSLPSQDILPPTSCNWSISIRNISSPRDLRVEYHLIVFEKTNSQVKQVRSELS